MNINWEAITIAIVLAIVIFISSSDNCRGEDNMVGYYLGVRSYHNYENANGIHDLFGVRVNDWNGICFYNSFGKYSKAVFYSKFFDNRLGFYSGMVEGYGADEEWMPFISPVYVVIILGLIEVNISGLPQLNDSGRYAVIVVLKTVDQDIKTEF